MNDIFDTDKTTLECLKTNKTTNLTLDLSKETGTDRVFLNGMQQSRLSLLHNVNNVQISMNDKSHEMIISPNTEKETKMEEEDEEARLKRRNSSFADDDEYDVEIEEKPIDKSPGRNP